MNTCLKFNDDVVLALVTFDDYGKGTISSQSPAKAAIDFSSGYSHTNNADELNSDAIMFLPADNQFAIDNFYRMEEVLVKLQLFGMPDSQAWFKVTKADVARDTQLCNEADHIECFLKKTATPDGG